MPNFNFATRLRLLRIALTRRPVRADLAALAREQGLAYEDVRGEIEPFAFAQAVLGPAAGGATAPDFARLIEPAESFTPPGAPAFYNSEPSVGRFLGQLVFHRQARVVVELGCFVGWTTAHLALALRARGGTGRLFAVDPSQDYLDTMRANLRRQQGLDGLVTPIRGLSLDPATLAALPGAIDLLFLDASHRYPETRDEILAYAPRLAPGGMIGLHDSISFAGVRRAVRELEDRFQAITFATERGNGLTVLRPRPGSP